VKLCGCSGQSRRIESGRDESGSLPIASETGQQGHGGRYPDKFLPRWLRLQDGIDGAALLTSFSSYKPGPEGTLFHLNLAAGRRSTYVLLYSSCRARDALVVWQGGAMADPITIGVLTASALAMAGEATLKGAVGEAAKDAYKALKSRVAQWAGIDVEALEQTPTSQARRAVVAEVVDSQSGDEQAAVRVLAEQLLAALKRSGPVGLDIGQLEAMEVQLGDITVTEGSGARFKEVRAEGTFSVGNISVGDNSKKP
jgi:hypothetical protein